MSVNNDGFFTEGFATMYLDENGQTLPGQLVKASYIADLLNLTPRSVRRLAHKGVIPQPVRIGTRMLRWRKDVVDSWVATCRVDPAEHQRIAAGE